MCSKTQRGYTLIELMVVVTIVGILAATAYGAYTGYTARADRENAKGNLYEIAYIMERGFTLTRDYRDVAISVSAFNDDYYSYDVPKITSTTYTITATIKNSRDTYNMRLDNLGTESRQASGRTSDDWTDDWDF